MINSFAFCLLRPLGYSQQSLTQQTFSFFLLFLYIRRTWPEHAWWSKPKFAAWFSSLKFICFRLEDGMVTDKLRYRYANQGVCRCMSGRGSRCDPADRQHNTIIPWAMVHTGKRNNQWLGCYGRVSNDSYFSTTITLPHPERKQGRVLHPTQVGFVNLIDLQGIKFLCITLHPRNIPMSLTTLNFIIMIGCAKSCQKFWPIRVHCFSAE